MPSPQPRPAIFDLNGTIVDDMLLHGELWREVALGYGRDIPASTFVRDWAGATLDEVLRRIAGRTLDAAEVRAVLDAREARYRGVFQAQVREVKGCSALLARLRGAGVPLAVATSSSGVARDFVLHGLGLAGAFDRLLACEDVKRGKPAPDLFLSAAAALGVPAEDCIVFEDAVAGITGALAAGMQAVGVTSVRSSEELLAAGATWAVPDYTQVPPDLLEALGLG